MPTKCVKVRIRDGCAMEVEGWAAELNRRSAEVRETLDAESVILEAVFLDRQIDGDHLIYVVNAPDFDRVAAASHASTAAIDVFHRAFKAKCWETRTPLPPLIDFGPEPRPASTISDEAPQPSPETELRGGGGTAAAGITLRADEGPLGLDDPVPS